MPRASSGRVPQSSQERAVVVKVILRDDRSLEDPFAEVNALAWTAGVEVVGMIPQRMERPNGTTYIGKGKLEEAARAVEELDADAVIVDYDLSPAQERNLEKILKKKVVDRTQLILDIFARRARTRQARLQVELAQLKYNLPRLKRLWGHLSRYEGGIGMRGPGETQLEEDKRLIRRRIQRLEEEIESIQLRNETLHRSRERDFVVAIVGYTNAGKSTLLNRLTGSSEVVEDKLFATLEGRTRRWKIGPNRTVLVSDTVGFIRNLPHHLVASFRATLEETRFADLLFHVVDASSPDAERQIATVDKVLRDLECQDKPIWAILNKWDAVGDGRIIEARHLRSRFGSGVSAFEVSAAAGTGIRELVQAIDGHLDRASVRVEAVVPQSRGDLVAWLCANGKVVLQEHGDEGVRIAADLSPGRAAKFRLLWPAKAPDGSFPPQIPD